MSSEPAVNTIRQSINQVPDTPSIDSTSIGMEVIGQTTLSLAVVIGIIYICFLVIKRFTNGTGYSKKHVKVVSSSMVGTKERVVIVEVRDTWLVLGVGNGNVNKLHELPKPEEDPLEERPHPMSFAARLADMRLKKSP